MKKRHLIFGSVYGITLMMILTLSSCDDGPVTPNDPYGNGVDTTWTDPNDSTYNDTIGGGNGGVPNDSTYNDTLGGGN